MALLTFSLCICTVKDLLKKDHVVYSNYIAFSEDGFN